MAHPPCRLDSSLRRVRPFAARLRCHAAVLALLCGLSAPLAVWAGDTPAPRMNDVAAMPEAAGLRFDFDIPAQPLAAALQRYASQSGRPALFDSAAVSGRTSGAVRGRHSPEAALHRLLEGTGLTAESARDGPADAFVLKPIDAEADAMRPAPDGVDTGYGAWVQARIWEALCADPRTAPGEYRTLLRFEVDATGALQRPRLLTSTGNARRDAAVREALQRVRVGRAPPPAMAQPLTMVLLPRDPGNSGDQAAGAQRCESPREATPP
ncbi:TonB C-terminal domain-containing protein [Variovorax sp. ZS18.2.2]|uniref:secretin and TonB N-terminal domain-containing protein n=1 Tax=Variovorax sp. ZS18.2.2 TaxID=2971255 RepID=UPI002151A9A8|nr:secretin and TonB N-terminal domain-containing protein [Variovorax sp. ZS18.2.2]MCR6475152.1 TonB C-terminal domain-containing protein [Variovorax sp. ZS18.2.2]